MTPDEVHALGVVTDVSTAGACYGISRSLAYDLVKRGEFPVPVLRVGSRYRVRVADLLTDLHLSERGEARAG